MLEIESHSQESSGIYICLVGAMTNCPFEHAQELITNNFNGSLCFRIETCLFQEEPDKLLGEIKKIKINS